MTRCFMAVSTVLCMLAVAALIASEPWKRPGDMGGRLAQPTPEARARSAQMGDSRQRLRSTVQEPDLTAPVEPAPPLHASLPDADGMGEAAENWLHGDLETPSTHWLLREASALGDTELQAMAAGLVATYAEIDRMQADLADLQREAQAHVRSATVADWPTVRRREEQVVDTLALAERRMQAQSRVVSDRLYALRMRQFSAGFR